MLNAHNHVKAGRPRDPHLDEAVLRAALELFSERGYQHVSLSEIARKAGVGTPAIYRRWPNKAAMAIEIVVRESRPQPIPDTGSIRGDLVEFFKGRLRFWKSPLFRQVFMPAASEAGLDIALAEQVREATVAYRAPGPVQRIRKAIASGQLRADTVPERLLDMLQGPIVLPLLLAQDVPDDTQAELIVGQALDGFASDR
jgi:AcrR family transcriptional regulator